MIWNATTVKNERQNPIHGKCCGRPRSALRKELSATEARDEVTAQSTDVSGV